MKKHTLLTIGLLSITSFAFIGVSAYGKAPNEENIATLSEPSTINEKSHNRAIEDAVAYSPEINYYNSNEISSKWTSSLESTIESELNDDLDNVNFIYYDLSSGEKISINGDEVVVAASTYKVGMNIIAYETVKNNELSLDEDLLYNSSQYFEGTGILQGELNGKLTKPINIQELLDLSITHSDNIATNMVSDRLGGKEIVREKMNSLVGLTCPTNENRTIAEIQYRLLRFIHEHRNEPYYSRLIDVMKNTVFHDRMDKYIPEELSAHKIGSYDSAISDIGIVDEENPYVFVMYTDGVDNAEEVIADISKIVYDAHQSKYQ